MMSSDHVESRRSVEEMLDVTRGRARAIRRHRHRSAALVSLVAVLAAVAIGVAAFQPRDGHSTVAVGAPTTSTPVPEPPTTPPVSPSTVMPADGGHDTITTSTSTPSTRTTTSLATSACPQVAFRPQSDDLVTDIRAVGAPCPLASQVAAASRGKGGQSFESNGYTCPTGSPGPTDAMGVFYYRCTAPAGRVITFTVTATAAFYKA
jgi:hypothetical protein